MLYRVGYKKEVARHAIRYVRASSAHDARVIAVETWGMNGTPQEMRSNWTPESYGTGYDAAVNTQPTVINTRMEAALMYNLSRTRDERMRGYQAKKTARNVAQQNIVISI